MLDHVFSPITINGMELKNRMVVTPMVTDYCNDDGTATEKWLADTVIASVQAARGSSEGGRRRVQRHRRRQRT